MNEQQQELYEKLLKKVNEYCLGYAAEDVIAAIDALVDNYERVNHLPKDKYKVARELLKDASPLQALENIIETFFDKDSEDIKTVRKALKALEIIKEKEVNVFIFLHSGDLETYNDMVEDNRKLTQEEYELLREVLK